MRKTDLRVVEEPLQKIVAVFHQTGVPRAEASRYGAALASGFWHRSQPRPEDDPHFFRHAMDTDTAVALGAIVTYVVHKAYDPPAPSAVPDAMPTEDQHA